MQFLFLFFFPINRTILTMHKYMFMHVLVKTFKKRCCCCYITYLFVFAPLQSTILCRYISLYENYFKWLKKCWIILYLISNYNHCFRLSKTCCFGFQLVLFQLFYCILFLKKFILCSVLHFVCLLYLHLHLLQLGTPCTW